MIHLGPCLTSPPPTTISILWSIPPIRVPLPPQKGSTPGPGLTPSSHPLSVSVEGPLNQHSLEEV